MEQNKIAASEWAWIEGHISVMAVLQGQNRPVESIFLRHGRSDSKRRQLLRAASSNSIPVQYVDDSFVETHARGQSHGGVLARVGPRNLNTLAELLPVGGANPFFVMLDGIEDPFNFGQAVRALYASGVAGLIVRPRNWLSAAGVVVRSSAGASELLPTAVAETALEAASFFRENGLTIACTARKSAVSLFEADLTQPLFLLVGGEKRGITRSFLEQADLRLRIPYGRPFARSLGAAASTAVLAFEILRQRF